jgi:hypothetical protein
MTHHNNYIVGTLNPLSQTHTHTHTHAQNNILYLQYLQYITVYYKLINRFIFK